MLNSILYSIRLWHFSEDVKEKALECLNSVTNGTVFYIRNHYSAPCNTSLIKNPDMLLATLNEMRFAYNRICSEVTPLPPPSNVTAF